MVAYVIAERLEHWDVTVFSEYRPIAAASIARFGGRYLAKTDSPILLEGEAAPLSMAVIEFPSLDQARAWFGSEEYQKAAAVRRRGARNRFLLLQGAGG